MPNVRQTPGDLWAKWKPKCKVVGAAIGAAAVYALQAVGVDLAAVVHEVAEVIDVNPPSEDAIAVAIGALAVAYLVPEDACER